MSHNDDQKLTDEEQALLDEATLKGGEPNSQHHPSMSPRLSRWPITGGVCLLLILLSLVMWGLSSSAKNNRNGQSSFTAPENASTLPHPAEAPELNESKQTNGSIPPKAVIAETPLNQSSTVNPNTLQKTDASLQQPDYAAQMRAQLDMQHEQQFEQEQVQARQEEKERAKQEADEQSAILNADSTVFSASSSSSVAATKPASNSLQAQISTSGASSYLPHTRMPAISPYEVKAGAVIPSLMLSGINSDLPGEIIAQVSQNVFDSATGHYLLIPQGARLVGSYDHGVVLGQQRVLISWNRIIYPDSSSVDIESMTGQDQSGYAGFKDKVNAHTWAVVRQAVLLSAISAGAQLSQPRATKGDYSYSAPQIGAAAMGQQLNQLGMLSYQSRGNQSPTITIRPGYRFNVMVNRDMILAPWNGNTATQSQNPAFPTALRR